MYPFTKQILNFLNNKKIGILILDVKGNYHKQVDFYLKELNLTNEIIKIEIGGLIRYNPLDKPNLKASVIANRLKTILTLFSDNNSDSYWLDKAEQILTECIKLCRLYNDNYVNFLEIHKLINEEKYYSQKYELLRDKFLNNSFTKEELYNLNTALDFFENEYSSLDIRVLSILKSEITRITSTFISDYEVYQTFCPKKHEINFSGFKEVLEKGKIVVLNMNIAEYKNLSKILASYLKLDFQTEILMQLSTQQITPSCFICDEYHEYITSNDADFFSQSREAQCINIVATQSYTSLLNTLKDEACVKVIVQNLINKLWFRTDDIFTIEDIQKQIGKEEKTKITRTFSENATETNFNYITKSLVSKNSNVSEGLSTYLQNDFIYDSNFFTQNLEVFSCLSFLSDGYRILKPEKLYLFPYFQDQSQLPSSENAEDNTCHRENKYNKRNKYHSQNKYKII